VEEEYFFDLEVVGGWWLTTDTSPFCLVLSQVLSYYEIKNFQKLIYSFLFLMEKG
jgi:hypothetical protein